MRITVPTEHQAQYHQLASTIDIVFRKVIETFIKQLSLYRKNQTCKNEVFFQMFFYSRNNISNQILGKSKNTELSRSESRAHKTRARRFWIAFEFVNGSIAVFVDSTWARRARLSMLDKQKSLSTISFIKTWINKSRQSVTAGIQSPSDLYWLLISHAQAWQMKRQLTGRKLQFQFIHLTSCFTQWRGKLNKKRRGQHQRRRFIIAIIIQNRRKWVCWSVKQSSQNDPKS